MFHWHLSKNELCLTGAVCARGERDGEQALSLWDDNEKWEEKNAGEVPSPTLSSTEWL